MATITITSPAAGYLTSIHESDNVRELYVFENDPFTAEITLDTGEVQLTDIKYRIASGTLPNNITLTDEDNCILYGTVIDIDTNDVYEEVTEADMQIDGSNYAQYYSAAEGQHDFPITIEAYCNIQDASAATVEVVGSGDFIIKVVNNYSSDRDQFIRDYTEAFGELNDNNEKVLFVVDGEKVTAEEYLTYQKSIGNFPALSNV